MRWQTLDKREMSDAAGIPAGSNGPCAPSRWGASYPCCPMGCLLPGWKDGSPCHPEAGCWTLSAQRHAAARGSCSPGLSRAGGSQQSRSPLPVGDARQPTGKLRVKRSPGRAGHRRARAMSAWKSISRSLYLTQCPGCSQEITAEAFLWERDHPTPYARLLSCTNCGHSGEYPVTQQDEARAAQYSASGLHHARALERVAYLPMTPTARMSSKPWRCTCPGRFTPCLPCSTSWTGCRCPPSQRRYLQALLLSACDRATPCGRIPAKAHDPASSPYRRATVRTMSGWRWSTLYRAGPRQMKARSPAAAHRMA